MIPSGDLFADVPIDPTVGRHGGNPVSSEAFVEIVPRLNGLLVRVLDYAARREDVGVTVKEVRAACDLSHQTASARMTELYNGGLLRNTGMRREGCGVRMITESGRTQLERVKAETV